jgi:glycosyltransferase involved in cell wall biosynthesis
MRVQLIGKLEPGISGMSRYTQGLYEGLQAAGLEVRLTFPRRAPIPSPMQYRLRRLGMDVEAFFATYPLRANLEGADIYHLTGQMLATLLLFQRFPRPAVVTVLDIIPYLVQHIPQLNTFHHRVDYWFYRLALLGLRRADALIAISEYTKRTLVEALQLPAERIHVVYPAVDHRKFRAMPIPYTFYAQYALDKVCRYILVVGSEDPRKNLDSVIQAFALVKNQFPHVKLIKIGDSQFVGERQKLLALIAEFDLQADVLLLNTVPDEDLSLFYNVADVCVMPSLDEGFGLPMVEAMACGTPVVCAQVGSLPEVVAEGSVQVNPRDVEALAQAILTLLQNEAERNRLRRVGQERSARFTWERTAAETELLYLKLMEQYRVGRSG